MSLKARITEDMKAAMRAKETVRLGAIRLLLAAIKQKEVDERIDVDDAQVATLVEKLLKQRRDSISQFEAAGRDDLAAIEKAEVTVLQAYMPEQLTEADVDTAVAAAIAESGATSAKDMGRAMALLKPRLAGRADMALVSKLLKARLG